MEINETKLNGIAWEVRPYAYDKAHKVLVDVAERVLCDYDPEGGDDLGEAIYYAIDCALIYAEDQWAILAEYCDDSPLSVETIHPQEAFDAFQEDVSAICSRYIGEEATR